jgi:RNA polymerase sigma factor (sigma-70 family)
MLDLALSSSVPPSVRTRRQDPYFADAYLRYRGVVRSALAQLGVPEADRDDLAQEVFVVLLRQLAERGEVADPSGLRGWFYQVSRRIAANHRRANRRRVRREDALGEVLQGDASPVREAVVSATIFLARFLEQLDEDGRAVFLLSEVEGLSGPELAARLGINLNTAYARVRAVRDRLRRKTEGECNAAWLALLPSALPKTAPGVASSLAALAWLAARISARTLWLGALLVLVVGVAAWLASGGGRGLRGPDASSPSPELGAREDKRTDAVRGHGDDDDASKVPYGGGSIAGRATTATGSAVPGTRVCIEPRRRSLGVRLPRCVEVDRSGAYAFDGLAAGVYGLAAAAPGHVEVMLEEAQQRVRLSPGQHRSGVDLRLRAGGAFVRGTVVDATGGPIEAAVVRPAGTITATFARSDAEGRFELWVDGDSTPELIADAEGYAAAHGRLEWPGVRDLELTLTPEATIDGIVVDESGVGVPGVAVIADAPAMVAYQSPSDEPSAITDDTGRFRLRALSPGRHHPLVRDSDWAGVATRPVVLGIGAFEAGVTIPVHRARRIQGTVERDGGGACGGAWVVVRDAVGDALDSTRSDGDGEVVLGGLPPEPVVVEIECQGALPLHLELDLGVGSRLEQTWRVTPRPGVAVRGHLFDPEGRPLAWATVSLRPVEPAAAGDEVSAFGHTDVDGRFDIGPLPAGVYAARLRVAGYAREASPSSLMIGDSVIDVDLHANPLARLRVHTVDDTGTAVTGVDVLFGGVDGKRGFATSGADAVAVLELAAGTYRVREAAVGEAGQPIEPDAFADAMLIDLETGDDDATLTVARRDGVVHGRVVGEDGAPVPDARVDIRPGEARADWHGGRQRSLVRQAWTDDSGAFIIGRLPPGSYLISAATPGGVAGEGVLASPGDAVTVILPRTGSLCGELIVDEGDPPQRFQVAVRTADGRRFRQQFAATEGSWCVEDIARGPAIVEVASIVGTASATVEVPDGGIERDIELRLVAGGHVAGRIIDSEGAPLRGAFVALRSDAGGLHSVDDGLRQRSADDGTFEVSAPTGTLEVVVYGPDGFGTRKLSATLRSGETTALGDIVLERRE